MDSQTFIFINSLLRTYRTLKYQFLKIRVWDLLDPQKFIFKNSLLRTYWTLKNIFFFKSRFEENFDLQKSICKNLSFEKILTPTNLFLKIHIWGNFDVQKSIFNKSTPRSYWNPKKLFLNIRAQKLI